MDIVRSTDQRPIVVKLEAREAGQVQGCAQVYLIYNHAHTAPYGLLEDVFVEEKARGQGVGTALINEAIAEAKARGCYKLICTSRHTKSQVHALYRKLGFINYGLEFRMDLI